ncbi:unnamed protein product [Nyctereutes procyonoides]|uniref:(raccoon dog) hypothetical protein n=1 Tax=Nyctereutes procyonoides TaxID=34880 RepID=A0A811ZED6_NYCPR|nr:unnamed protein product [Nyctereutes procyonoides]
MWSAPGCLSSRCQTEEPGGSFSHPGNMGLDENIVHDQEGGDVSARPAALLFKMLDYDGDNLWDGLDLSIAITQEDKNNNEYIDHVEFAKSLQVTLFGHLVICKCHPL